MGAMTDFDFDVQGLGANNLRFRILFDIRHFTGKRRTEDHENGSKTVLGMYHVQNSIYELVHQSDSCKFRLGARYRKRQTIKVSKNKTVQVLDITAIKSLLHGAREPHISNCEDKW